MQVAGAVAQPTGAAVIGKVSARPPPSVSACRYGRAPLWWLWPALPNEMIDNVCTVVENHMIPWDNMSDRAVRRLRNRLGDTPCSVLCQTIMSDINGRGSRVSVAKVEELYTRLVNIDNRQSGMIEPLVKGRHLINAGFTPSKKFGVALDTVYDLQIDHNLPFNDLLEVAIKLMKRL